MLCQRKAAKLRSIDTNFAIFFLSVINEKELIVISFVQFFSFNLLALTENLSVVEI